MGEITGWRCPGCGYEADVESGWGFEIEQTPMICRDCRELVSATVARQETGQQVEVEPRCPRCGGRNLDVWPMPEDVTTIPPERREGGPCPGCGVYMVATARIGIWD